MPYAPPNWMTSASAWEAPDVVVCLAGIGQDLSLAEGHVECGCDAEELIV